MASKERHWERTNQHRPGQVSLLQACSNMVRHFFDNDLMMLKELFEARHMRKEYIAAAIRKVSLGVVELRSCVAKLYKCKLHPTYSALVPFP